MKSPIIYILELFLSEKARAWRKKMIRAGIGLKEIERMYLEKEGIEVTGW